ncbi:MAG: NADH-quinone oxidoreductase subunit A [Thermoanaerobaculia bacterium]|nr:NADH-quinone oxidoreductase subunit A [Thermoanaerobaculia bacterium]
MIGVSWLLGERHREPATDETYESGIASTGTARNPFSLHFYLIAVFFVIFDLEAVFLFAWAISVEKAGWVGFVEILVFVGILLAALVYLWRVGALDWGTIRHLKEKGLRKEFSP